MLAINEKNRDLAKRLYPDGPARIRARMQTRAAADEEPIYQLIVGVTQLRVAWSDNVRELREYAEQHGWRAE